MLNATDFEVALRKAQRGDDDAFARLWRAYQPLLLRALSVVAGDAAGDIAADTWLDVVRGLPRFDGDEAGFRAWLFTIAHHQRVDWQRWLYRPPPTEDGERIGAAAVPAADAIASLVDERLATERALRLVASLPPDVAEIVALRAIAGLDVSRVAAIVGRRRRAVRALSHRELERLAEVLRPLHAPAYPSELADERSARRVFALAQYALGPAAARRAGPVRRIATTVAIAAGLIIATAGLAGAHALPPRVQELAARALSAIGVHVPLSDDHHATGPKPVHRDERPATATTPPVTAPTPPATTAGEPPAPTVLTEPAPAGPSRPPEPAPPAALPPAPPESPPPAPTTTTTPTPPADHGVGNGGVPGAGGANPNAAGTNRGGNGSGNGSTGAKSTGAASNSSSR